MCLFACSTCFGEPLAPIGQDQNVPLIQIFYQKDPIDCIQRIDTVRRAAFDFGGGSIRMLVADVNLKTKKIEKLFSAAIKIRFRLDLSKNNLTNEFSEEIQKVAHAAMPILLEASAPYAPQQFSATATESFRMAKNGQQLLQAIAQDTGVPINIINQEEEGRIGYLSVITHLSSHPENTVVIDLGSGSVQITAQNADGSLKTHGMKLGTIVLRDIIAKQMRNLQTSPDDINPVMEEEAHALIQFLDREFHTLPDELVKKMQSKEVRVIAACGNAPLVIRSDSGWNLLKTSFLEQTGEKIEGSAVNSIFVYALIRKFAVEECRLVNLKDGNTSGMLITEQFWIQ